MHVTCYLALALAYVIAAFAYGALLLDAAHEEWRTRRGPEPAIAAAPLAPAVRTAHLDPP